MMGKIRVHELAKELGLDNKEVIDKLQRAGIAVKSHSSSVQEDEARAALAPAAETPATPTRRPGMMIVRKRDKDAEEAAAESTDAVEAQSESQAEATEQESAEALEAETAAPRADVTEEAPEESEDEATPAAAAKVEAEPAAEVAAPAKPTPAQPGSPVLRMIDREKLLERLPARRLGGAPRGDGGPGGPQRFGQVTELRVVQDPFGRGREMIAVGKDRKPGRGPQGPAGAAGAKKKSRAPSKREMMEMRERAMHPARLRKKKVGKRGPVRKTELTQPKASKRVVKMKATITVADLAAQLGVKANELIRALMGMDMMVTANRSIDFDTASILAAEYDYTVESVAFSEEDALSVSEEVDDPERLEPRPPVVTVMGHVDHGKTSLLDAIRNTRVVAKEAGGITQHIGAYQVEVPKKGMVTFLDTPGHAAFTSMRARGAQVTDIVILVVAADDGVMPQTEEAIRHAQAAKVPIIVAVNKIDKPDANPDRVMQELSKFNLLPEAWGGETIFVNTSATKGTGIDDLLESVLLQAEVMELRANPERPAVAVVVEAQLDKGRGAVATVLVQRGTLKRGDFVVVGEHAGKVRAMTDDRGRQVKAAGPSTPVEIIGLSEVPDAGDQVHAVATEKQAKEIAEHRGAQRRETEQEQRSTMSLDQLMAKMRGDDAPELKVVLKADVHGSAEAIRDSVVKLATDEVKVNVVYSGVGAVSESDVMLAMASRGLVLAFNVRPDANARAVAEREGVEIRTYTIIYEMLDDVKKAMEGLLTPESREKIVGRAEVREVFRVAKVGAVAGCKVVDGKAMRNAKVRLVRDGVQVFDGRVSSLRRFKDDAREVDSGQECGVGLEGYNDLKQGDVLEFYQMEEVARLLEDSARTRKPPKSGGGAEAHP